MNTQDILESRSFVSNETTTSWYNDETMMSSVAVHGFCFYVKLIADVGSKLGCANKIDLTSEVLASTTNTMALGKLSRLDIAKNTVIYTGKELELNNPMERYIAFLYFKYTISSELRYFFCFFYSYNFWACV
jgi:hypothetical protein